MMAETPTTDEVRDSYENGIWNDGLGDGGPHVIAAFDRWLATVRAEALREAHAIICRRPGAYEQGIDLLARAIEYDVEATS